MIRNTKNEIFSIIPTRVAKILDKAIPEYMWKIIEEIRIFKRGSIVVCTRDGRYYVSKEIKLVSDGLPYHTDDMVLEEIIKIITGCSEYAYKYHLASGYVTSSFGHRICFTGRASLDGSKTLFGLS